MKEIKTELLEKSIDLRDFCEKYNIDLDKSFAYGDTHGDITMLELVGHPKAINPSLELLTNIKNTPNLMDKTEIIIERKDVIYSVNSDVKVLNNNL